MNRKCPFSITDAYNIERPVSSNDMTGLIPAALEDEEEAEAYEALYPSHRQIPVRPGAE